MPTGLLRLLDDPSTLTVCRLLDEPSTVSRARRLLDDLQTS